MYLGLVALQGIHAFISLKRVTNAPQLLIHVAVVTASQPAIASHWLHSSTLGRHCQHKGLLCDDRRPEIYLRHCVSPSVLPPCLWRAWGQQDQHPREQQPQKTQTTGLGWTSRMTRLQLYTQWLNRDNYLPLSKKKIILLNWIQRPAISFPTSLQVLFMA